MMAEIEDCWHFNRKSVNSINKRIHIKCASTAALQWTFLFDWNHFPTFNVVLFVYFLHGKYIYYSRFTGRKLWISKMVNKYTLREPLPTLYWVSKTYKKWVLIENLLKVKREVSKGCVYAYGFFFFSVDYFVVWCSILLSQKRKKNELIFLGEMISISY